MLPELLHVFGTTDTNELRAFQIGSIGKQDIRHVVRFVERVSEGDNERHFCHRLDHATAVPKRNCRVAAKHEPKVWCRWLLPFGGASRKNIQARCVGPSA